MANVTVINVATEEYVNFISPFPAAMANLTAEGLAVQGGDLWVAGLNDDNR